MRSLIAASLAAAAMASSDHWAVIIAGSNTYGNYRHQSDAHHAYKIMVENDIPEDQIILMVYDDVANNFRNPYRGQLFNSPTGPNVYDQTTISYSGAEVNKDTFVAVLTGDSAAAGGKPVLQSNANSKVFIYYSDHGATGLVAMPTGDYLYADELQAAIDTMEANQMYDEVVFYLEACESGSMFPDLQASQKVYAMTASNAYQSSYAAYCGSDAYVDGVNIGSCLGDEFSVSWMEDTESHNINTETLQVQHDTVKTLTTGSPVQIFGDFDIMSEPVANFEGNVAHTITEDD
jgi:legumain